MVEGGDLIPILYWIIVLGLSFLIAAIVERNHGEREECIVDHPGPPLRSKVPQNFWGLNLIVAVQQAFLYGSRPTFLSPLILLVTVFKGLLQLAMVMFIVLSIDPDSKPKTTSRDLEDSFTHVWCVNSAKWAMSFLIAVIMSTEMQSCMLYTEAILLVNPRRLVGYKGVLLFTAFLQLAIAVATVWGGIVVVLSFHTVPNIVYSSMSISMIVKMDPAILAMFVEVLDVQGSFTIVHGIQKHGSGESSSSDSETARDAPSRSPPPIRAPSA